MKLRMQGSNLCSPAIGYEHKYGANIKKDLVEALTLRRQGSNLRPSGYEPDELPLLYFAMWGAKVRGCNLPAKLFIYFLINLIIVSASAFYACSAAGIYCFHNSGTLVINSRTATGICIQFTIYSNSYV